MGNSFPEKHWYRLSYLSFLLWPLSLLFRMLVGLRRLLYRLRILPEVKLPVPVIIVGNLTAGGTGKTPLVLWLAALLRARGWQPGIVSRGYAGSSTHPISVNADSAPDVVGDEPVILARRSGCPVWIGRDRAMSATALLAANPHCDVLILDDGLQHYALARDIEIAVEDERGAGNGLMLPAGPLREPVSRHVDARVRNAAGAFPEVDTGVFSMRLVGDTFRAVGAAGDSVDATALAGMKTHAIAGIGNPGRFFDHLAGLGLKTVNHPFPDHHAYSAGELEFADCEALLMTEKDAVKCTKFARSNWYALQVEAELAPAFTEFILAKLHGLKTA